MVGMEAAVVSGLLKIVSNKLAPLLIKEYSLIVGVQKHLLELKDQVQEINYWLEAVGDQVSPNTPAFNWLRKLKDMAYDVDDIVDEFQLVAEEHEAHGVAGVMSKYLCQKPQYLILQCKAASKLKAVKKRFDAIVKQRTEFNAIAYSLLAGHPALDMSQTTANRTTLPTVDVASVLGRDQEKYQIISKLVDDKHIIKTISVIGLGGSGKTTLAKLVFNDCSIVEKHFEVRLWVHVSQEFDVDKLIKKLFEAFADSNPGQHALPYMTKIISEKLTGKRLLLVLDDMWNESLIEWENFMVHLKSSGPGSRILLTTRSRRVSETVRSIDKFHLSFLSLHDSWQLFQQSLVIPAEGLDSEFVKVGKEIAEKCGGVPLAIKVIAGVLQGKKQIQEWESMRDSNVLDIEGKECVVSACLRLSYFNLPSQLKQCFAICSLFPKGHDIVKEQLIDLWIAHNMVTVEDPSDYLNLEHVGEKHFNFLLEVSFLQNVIEINGRVTCEMHDLVHDLALSILGDEISVDVPKEASSSATRSYRYFSLIKKTEHMAPKNIFRKARAIYMPKQEDYRYDMALKHAKHLRSVTVGYLDAEGANTIFQVKYLKYLAVSALGCKTLPEGISDAWRLQALHLNHSWPLVEITESIGKLKMLRTLNLSDCPNLKSLPDSVGDCHMISSIDLFNCSKLTVLPDSIGKLKKLRTLNLEWCIELKCLPDSIGDCETISSINLRCCWKFTGLPNSIGRNKMLRELRLGDTKVERLPSSITKLKNLECLDLGNCRELLELPEGIGNLDKLQVLNLTDCRKLGVMPVGIGQLSRLQKLGLFAVGKGEKFAAISELANVSRLGWELRIIGIQHVMDLNDVHMACLKQKTNLQRLGLNWISNKMEEVDTELQQDVLDGLEPPPSIKRLDILGYSGRQYAGWMQSQVGGRVQGPAPFPFLRVMWLWDFPKLKHLDGLVELPCLEELVLEMMPCLESISGGPFLSLVKLKLLGLPSLGEAWMVAERAMPDGEDGGCCCNLTPHLGQVRVGSCLTELDIEDCPKLEVMPHLPLSLQRLILEGSGQVLQSPGQCQGSSSSTTYGHQKKLNLGQLTGLGSGHGWEGQLTSLQTLSIRKCKGLTSLPQGIKGLVSLEELYISSCPGIQSLPEGIKGLTALKVLLISGCPDLERRCERGKGEDWHLISHIPSRRIY